MVSRPYQSLLLLCIALFGLSQNLCSIPGKPRKSSNSSDLSQALRSHNYQADSERTSIIKNVSNYSGSDDDAEALTSDSDVDSLGSYLAPSSSPDLSESVNSDLDSSFDANSSDSDQDSDGSEGSNISTDSRLSTDSASSTKSDPPPLTNHFGVKLFPRASSFPTGSPLMERLQKNLSDDQKVAIALNALKKSFSREKLAKIRYSAPKLRKTQSDPITARNYSRERPDITPLMRMAYNGDWEGIKELKERNKTFTNSPKRKTRSWFGGGRSELSQQAQNILATDRDGNTAFHWAMKGKLDGSIKHLFYLLQHAKNQLNWEQFSNKFILKKNDTNIDGLDILKQKQVPFDLSNDKSKSYARLYYTLYLNGVSGSNEYEEYNKQHLLEWATKSNLNEIVKVLS